MSLLSRRASALLTVALIAGCGDDASDPAGDTGTDLDAGSDAGADIAPNDAGPGDVHDADAPDAAPLVFCTGETQHLYDPYESESLLLWPDNVYTMPDDDSPTGLRLSIQDAAWVGEIPLLLRPLATDIEVLSGFGSNAAAVLRFDTAVDGLPTNEADSLDGDAVLFVDLSTSPPERVPFEVELSDEGRDVIVWPLRPLRRGADHAVVITNALQGADGGCVRPSPVTEATLRGDAHDDVREAWMEALDALDIAASEVSGMTVFTVHDDLGPVVRAAQQIAQDETLSWVGETECDDGSPRLCTLEVETYDYRDERFVRTGDAGDAWTLPVHVWLPDGDGPFPYVMYGHGLNGSASQGRTVARILAELGVATVATDAMVHGAHPTANPDAPLPALDFLGIDFESTTLDPLTLRGNFDQTVLDRLQLLRTIALDPDVDGDGAADLDSTTVGYWGISLGAMLGSGLTALSTDVEASVLSVGGGRLLTFATDTEQVATFMPLLTNLIGSEELFTRLLPVAQTMVDPADPATYGAHILVDRLNDHPAPNLLFPVALHDETVPPATGRALARAIGAPQLGEAFRDVSVIGRADAPLSGNVDGGRATAAHMQFDRVTRGEGVAAATHGNMPTSEEARAQVTRFFQTWLDTGVSEIIDPYALLETPALDE